MTFPRDMNDEFERLREAKNDFTSGKNRSCSIHTFIIEIMIFISRNKKHIQNL